MDKSSATFVVRLARTAQGAWTAVVERVRTGEKYRVKDIEAIGALIAGLVGGKTLQPDDVSQSAADPPRAADL